jgi:hypothetical protein
MVVRSAAMLRRVRALKVRAGKNNKGKLNCVLAHLIFAACKKLLMQHVEARL